VKERGGLLRLLLPIGGRVDGLAVEVSGFLQVEPLAAGADRRNVQRTATGEPDTAVAAGVVASGQILDRRGVHDANLRA